MTENVEGGETTMVKTGGDDADLATGATDVESDATELEADTTRETAAGVAAGPAQRGVDWSRVVAFIVLPALALLLAAGAGYLKWQDNSVRNSEVASITSVQAARDTAIALLSYAPDTVEQQLGAARERLTGEFLDSYTTLTNDVIVPGAKEQQISAIASVPAAASVSATPDRAVVLLFVNQTVTVGSDAPTDNASSVRVTLERHGDRWLISEFDPV
ncbi:Mce-associated membrane protein [Mycolicibacterium iranicum]|uniref:Mce-associated membrane protein n=1 Tax=Mycolicibacterium iranicum TaxID=912594 RepID=A0A839QEF6_MYCIR|nr:hypothetical protein [Mycolicibacterium iranicum]MBB2993164.1 Mce-associated membrane protein [Mycolicibacterium iranicum]